jgi:hypothetical protein
MSTVFPADQCQSRADIEWYLLSNLLHGPPIDPVSEVQFRVNWNGRIWWPCRSYTDIRCGYSVYLYRCKETGEYADHHQIWTGDRPPSGGIYPSFADWFRIKTDMFNAQRFSALSTMQS